MKTESRVTHPLSTDVQIIALRMTEISTGIILIKERNRSGSRSCAVLTAEEYVEQHTTPNSLGHVGMCGGLWKIGQLYCTLCVPQQLPSWLMSGIAIAIAEVALTLSFLSRRRIAIENTLLEIVRWMTVMTS